MPLSIYDLHRTCSVFLTGVRTSLRLQNTDELSSFSMLPPVLMFSPFNTKHSFEENDNKMNVLGKP